MRPYIELFINNQKVYFQNPPEIFITYAHTELHNPTVVKNSYTKTVTVEGTPENNRIFNDFYDMRRINGDGLFNPSHKESFVLYRNGEPMESGYVKLDKVNKKNGRITYDITLYGGLGQFLYNLQYKEDGEKMKLSDLDYGYDMNIKVNKDAVVGAWNRINGTAGKWSGDTYTIYDHINFAPCYNGIPENFSADKVAIDVNSFKGMNPRLYDKITNTDEYKAAVNNGYGLVNDKWCLGELKKEYDEWQMKDLRSYLQRPVIRFKDVITACCNPDNNGGYSVVLDPDFFNVENPYYENAWMTLPLLSEMEGVEKTGPVLKIENGNLVLDGVDGTTIKKFTVPMFMQATANADGVFRLYTGVQITLNPSKNTWVESYNSCRYAQLVVYDKNGKVVNGSNVNAFYTNIKNATDFNIKPVYNAAINKITGNYVNAPSTNLYIFNAEFYDFTITNLKWEDGYYMQVIIKSAEIKNYEDLGEKVGIDYLYKKNEYYKKDDTVTDILWDSPVVAEDVKINEKKPFVTYNRIVNKKTLLNSENTPCDYFLSYLKMFNLHIWKDMYDNIIYIKLRKNFFTGDVKDIDESIDRSGDIVIKPLTFENKWLNFKAEYEQDEKLHKDYLDNYGIDYGIQKVDTNYNFDSSSKDILENYVFKGCVTSRNRSKYYVDIYQPFEDDDVYYPPFMLDGVQTLLFNAVGDTTEGSYLTPKTTVNIIQWWKEKYYDLFPKPSFVNDKNEGVEGANVLLFYTGKQSTRDVDGHKIEFQISDDIVEFGQLNDGEPCWIWTLDTDVVNNAMNYYPVFSRYIVNENGWVTHSWDFGTPKALYIPDYSIDESSSLYSQYWKPYIRDQYDSNTRVVECKVLLRERVIGDWLQNFYYFDGRYWVLNKITDYNPTSNQPTKCEFVRVNDIQNYLL